MCNDVFLISKQRNVSFRIVLRVIDDELLTKNEAKKLVLIKSQLLCVVIKNVTKTSCAYDSSTTHPKLTRIDNSLLFWTTVHSVNEEMTIRIHPNSMYELSHFLAR